MARKNGSTTARKEAQVSDCIRMIAEDNSSQRNNMMFQLDGPRVSGVTLGKRLSNLLQSQLKSHSNKQYCG